MTKLAIVDDDIRFSSSLKAVLIDLPEIEFINTYNSGESFISAIKKITHSLIPEVVLMDISMRLPKEGIDTTRNIKENFPNIHIIMFTNSDDDEYIFEAFKAGAVGYLLKNESPSFIAKTILDVKNGNAQVSPSIAHKMIKFFHSLQSKKKQKEDIPKEHWNSVNILSERELEILELTARGHTYQYIADSLFIASGTVKKHIRNIFEKLQVNNKIEALKKVGKLPPL